MPTHAPPARLPALVLALAVLWTGCDLVTYRPPIGRDFGAPYQIVAGVPVSIGAGLRVQTPAVDATRRLVAVVEYRGGCGTHAFSPASEAAENGRTRLWLVHDAGGDQCLTLIRDTLRVDLGAAFRSGPLSLAVPGGDDLPLAAPPGGN